MMLMIGYFFASMINVWLGIGLCYGILKFAGVGMKKKPEEKPEEKSKGN